MQEEHIQQLIESIEYYDEIDHAPYYVLWYFDGEDFEIQDQYFAVMAVKIKPDEKMMDRIRWHAKPEIGNAIFGADYVILDKENAIEHLENLMLD